MSDKRRSQINDNEDRNCQERKSRLMSRVFSGASLLAVSCLSLLLALALSSGMTGLLGQHKESNLLTILILSTRGNFAQRQAVRDTWMSLASKERVKTLFVIGQSCMTHPDDRIDEFDCLEQRLPEIDQVGALDGWTVSLVSPDGRSRPTAKQFKFTVLHAIVVTELTLYKTCAPGNDGVTISIYDRTTQSQVVNGKVTTKATDNWPDVMTVGLENSITLPQGFEGLITIEEFTNCTHSVHATYNCSPFIACIREAGVETIPVMGFRFRLSEKADLLDHVSGRESRHMSWRLLQQSQERKLDVERDKYNDILRVNSVDVYRNLPDKLLNALHWAHNEVYSEYIMKTDDDCYINTTSFLYKLAELMKAGVEHNLWLGNFRRNWALDDYGKWAEHTYTGLTYPWFACGAGYVLSADVVAWLSANRKQLNRFQGEDVSVGIWLSAVSIHYIQYDDVICTRERSHMASFAALPELSADEMRHLHNEV